LQAGLIAAGDTASKQVTRLLSTGAMPQSLLMSALQMSPILRCAAMRRLIEA